MADLLIEIGTEELPSGAVQSLGGSLANNLMQGLVAARLQYGVVKQFATPRRLAVLIRDVQLMQQAASITKRGPAYDRGLDAAGLPTPALRGFAASCGVAIAELSIETTDKGQWWQYTATNAGLPALELLPQIFKQAVDRLLITKPMRWGNSAIVFVRPVHWLVFLLDDIVVDCDALGVTSGRVTYGHRFHAPAPISISAPDMYEEALNQAYVVADFARRRQLVVERVTELSSKHGYSAVMPAALVDEVTSIVEWPVPLCVPFDAEFLLVPNEALIAAMQSHQKCFAQHDAAGNLVPYFITVANIESMQPSSVIAGNEKVMRARLSDAAFFYNQDRKKPLCDYYAATDAVIFQKNLGSLQDKARRMEAFMEYFVVPLALDAILAKRAAMLSQCSLLTGMVNEFPELQGLMGYYYALNDGENSQVAIALNEQYMPRFADDDLPQSTIGSVLSLVMRLDTLAGAFASGQRPTATKDPFKLRRQALAVARVLMLIPEKLSLTGLLQYALNLYGDKLAVKPETLDELKIFILDRLHAFYQSQEIMPTLVTVVRARQNDCLYDLDQRVKACVIFMQLPEAVSLAAACKRVDNLLQRQENFMAVPVQEHLFTHDAEVQLYADIIAMEQWVDAQYSAGNYTDILRRLATLRVPIDAFFEHVMVMVPELNIRENRLRLLAQLQTLLLGVADFSQL